MQSDKTFTSHTGKLINVFDLRPKDIDFRDIAHHLSMICRFGGACSYHYSVALHSLFVTELGKLNGCSKQLQLKLLLHDSAEAYMGDIVRPIKSQYSVFAALETEINKAISDKFSIDLTMDATCKKFDNLALAFESERLLDDNNWTFHKMINMYCVDPEDVAIFRNHGQFFLRELPTSTVKGLFVDKYLELIK